jgi:hypothetical protein
MVLAGLQVDGTERAFRTGMSKPESDVDQQQLGATDMVVARPSN